MKTKLNFILITLLFLIYHNSSAQEPANLFPIIKNNQWGFMNSKGKVIIKPKFRSVGKFKDGLAPVRIEGTYGFINKRGKFVISPQYDAAHPFKNGLAKVYIDSKPFLIDKKGQIAFQHNLENIQGFNEFGLAIIGERGNKCGLINQKGELILDTVYARINPFSEGLSVVWKKQWSDAGDFEGYQQGVVNSKGHFVFPLCSECSISPFKNGYANLSILNKKTYKRLQYVINKSGKKCCEVPMKKWRFSRQDGYYSEGLRAVDIYVISPDSSKKKSHSKKDFYAGVVNPSGIIMFSNKDWIQITPFQNNRAFAQNSLKKWVLINNKGDVISDKQFDQILYDKYNDTPYQIFKDGLAIVLEDQRIGLIDTLSNYIIQNKYLEGVYFYTNAFMNFERHGDFLLLKEDISTKSDKYSYQYGFWNFRTGTLVRPTYHDISFPKTNEDPIYTIKDDKIEYLNAKGRVLWKENQNSSNKKLNIDFMNRGYFYASSPFIKELAGVGGWGISSNASKEISKLNNFEKEQLALLVRPEEKEIFKDKYLGIKLYIANTSSDSFFFKAQDSRLYLKIQAQDKHGNWKYIEYSPSSWCGNSYHQLFLPPNYYWEFTIPEYEGEFKTKLRAELLYRPNSQTRESSILYSNEYEGSINPAQFWRKTPYYTSGLMDPYND